MTRPAHFERYRLRLEPLSPIHIGSGEAIEPHEYVLEPRGDGGVLSVLDMPALLTDLGDRERASFMAAVDTSRLTAVRRWIQDHADPKRHARCRVSVAPGVFGAIRQHIDDPRRAGEIELLTRDAASGLAVLPGSSIKGAVRTAIVDTLAREDSDQGKLLAVCERGGRRAGANFEATVLGHAEDRHGRTFANLNRDPLRQVAFSDLQLPRDSSYITRVKIRRQAGDISDADPSGIVIYREVTWGAVLGQDVVFDGECRFFPGLNDRNVMGSDKVLPRHIDVVELCRCCNAFYRPRLEQEAETFLDSQWRDRLLQELQPLADDDRRTCLIRLGRHSHFECVTVGAPFHHPPPKGFGKTRSYDRGVLPLGWARLRFEEQP